MIKKSKVTCSGCKSEFEKENRYIKIAEKKGRRHFCSLKCQAKYEGLTRLPGDSWNKSKKNIENLKKNCTNRKDEYSEFKPFLKSCRSRTKVTKKDFDLDLHYLKELWEKQKGKCVLTNVDLSLNTNENKNYQASLDRIDSSKGYLKGNVRYISVSANWLKNNLSDDHISEFISICQKIDQKNSLKVEA